MKQINNPIQFPCDAQSNPFFCALVSALLPTLGITEETPYYCAKNDSLCVQCGDCGVKTNMQKHHEALYHDYQTVTGVSFGWVWPEDYNTEYQIIENGGPGWNWPDKFIDYIMAYSGLAWRRLSKGRSDAAVHLRNARF